MKRGVYCYCLLVFFLGYASPLFGQLLERYEVSQVSREGRLNQQLSKAETYININTFPKSAIKVELSKGTSFFAGGKALYYAEKDTSIFIPLIHLSDDTSEVVGDSIQLTFLGERKAPNIKVSKGYFDKEADMVEANKEESEMDFRQKSLVTDFYVIAALLTLALLAVFRTVNPSVLSSMLIPNKLFEAEEEVETGFVAKVFSASTVFYNLVLSMALALIGLIVMLWAHPFGMEINLDFNTLFFFWLCGILVFMGLGFLKFLWIKFSAFIFGCEVVEVSQFMFMLRVISLIAISLFLVLLVATVNYPLSIQEHIGTLVKIVFFIYLLGVGMFLVMVHSRGSFKFYHLFSYICTAELIPFLVITKLLMG